MTKIDKFWTYFYVTLLALMILALCLTLTLPTGAAKAQEFPDHPNILTRVDAFFTSLPNPDQNRQDEPIIAWVFGYLIGEEATILNSVFPERSYDYQTITLIQIWEDGFPRLDNWPVFYCWDRNGNGVFEPEFDEIMIDPDIDGWNGNEVFIGAMLIDEMN